MSAAALVLMLWALHLRVHHDDRLHAVFLATSALVLAYTFTPVPDWSRSTCSPLARNPRSPDRP
ncbi:hypothetical protein ACVGOW_23785 [Pseudonocardia saturnea]